MNDETLKVAAVQMEVRVGGVEWNLNHSIDLIHQAAEKVDLICFPESVLDGYTVRKPEELALCARPVPGPETDRIAELARFFGVWIMWSLAEKVDDQVANTAILFDRVGNIQLVYRKVHLCCEENEHIVYLPGQGFPVVALEHIKVGAMICFDRHFPETTRTMRLQGADLILHPTATDWFTPDPGSINTALMRTHAYANRCFVLSVNQVNYGGGSALFDPWGQVLAIAGVEEEILFCEVDPKRIHAVPENNFKLFERRRPETYIIHDAETWT